MARLVAGGGGAARAHHHVRLVAGAESPCHTALERVCCSADVCDELRRLRFVHREKPREAAGTPALHRERLACCCQFPGWNNCRWAGAEAKTAGRATPRSARGLLGAQPSLEGPIEQYLHWATPAAAKSRIFPCLVRPFCTPAHSTRHSHLFANSQFAIPVGYGCCRCHHPCRAMAALSGVS